MFHQLNASPGHSLLNCGSIARFITLQAAKNPGTQNLSRGRKFATGPSPRLQASAHNHGKIEFFAEKSGNQVDGHPIPVALRDGYASESKEDSSIELKTFLQEKLQAFFRFSRPHTVIGTVIGITSVSLLPVQTIGDLSPAFFLGLLKALVPSVLMNIYIVGLNQLFDVEIDKVNKPDLPIASGDFSMSTGVNIVFLVSFLSMFMGFQFQSPPLFFALFISFLLGSAYSIEFPGLRWKKNPFLAASSILVVRAIVVQLAFFVHMQKYVLGRPIVITKTLMFATAFMCFFSAVIALFKDIPDVDGDKYFGIHSLSVKLGKENVFWLCIKLLLIAYGAAIVVASTSTSLPTRLIAILGHMVLALLLVYQAPLVDLSSKASITAFYMFIWKLFYAEYFLIPFVR